MTDAEALVGLLVEAGCTVAVAESLTGGAVCEAVVGVPGASACLRGGVVAYATDLKTSLLGVPERLLTMHGPVHADVARAMALGVRRRLGADYGVSTTGVAGPAAQDGRPVGTVHVAVAGPWGARARSLSLDPASSRAQVRAAARDAALALAVQQVRADVALRRSEDQDASSGTGHNPGALDDA